MKELNRILNQASKELSQHPRVAVVWQDLNLVYRRVHNAGPEWGDDIVGHKLEDLAGETDVTRHITQVKRRVIESIDAHHELATIKLKGRDHVYDLTIEPTFNSDGAVDGLVSVFIDLSDLIAARDKLASANERVSKMIDGALKPDQD